MLTIRLQRVGRKNDPSFRVIVTDSKNAAKRGVPVEVVGSYDARKGEPQLNAERIKYWTGVGAKLSGTVNNLLIKAKVMDGKKINVLPKKTVPVKAEPAPAEAAGPGKEAKPEAPKVEETVSEEPKTEAPKAEEVKTEEAATEPTTEEPKAE